MIQMQTRLDVADNSGAKKVQCIKVLGGTRRMYAGIGDLIVCSVKKALPSSDIKPGEIVSLSWSLTHIVYTIMNVKANSSLWRHISLTFSILNINALNVHNYEH